jgi:hypothetical protein
VYVPTLSNSRNASHSFIAAGWTAVSADFRANDKATENIAFDGAVEWSQHAGPCAACKTKLSFFLSFFPFLSCEPLLPKKKLQDSRKSWYYYFLFRISAEAVKQHFAKTGART